MTHILENISTTKREEMVCPHCFEKSLEGIKHIEKKPEISSQKQKIFRATTCNSNRNDCPYQLESGRTRINTEGNRTVRVPEKYLKLQYGKEKKEGRLDRVNTPKIIATLLLFLVIALYTATTLL